MAALSVPTTIRPVVTKLLDPIEIDFPIDIPLDEVRIRSPPVVVTVLTPLNVIPVVVIPPVPVLIDELLVEMDDPPEYRLSVPVEVTPVDTEITLALIVVLDASITLVALLNLRLPDAVAIPVFVAANSTLAVNNVDDPVSKDELFVIIP